MTEKLISAKELAKYVPYSRTHIRRLEAAGLFPKRIQIGPRRIAYKLSEVQEWIKRHADAA